MKYSIVETSLVLVFLCLIWGLVIGADGKNSVNGIDIEAIAIILDDARILAGGI